MILLDRKRIAMAYESLINAIYEPVSPWNKGYWKGMDPLGFGDADLYSRFVTTEGTPKFDEGKIMLSAALGALAYRFPKEVTAKTIRDLLLRLGAALS